jgi:hypothetical protein
VFVTHAVERRQHVAGEVAGFFQDGCGDVAVEIAVMAGCDCGLKARAVIEREQNVVYRGTVGHDDTLAWGRGPLPTSNSFSE